MSAIDLLHGAGLTLVRRDVAAGVVSVRSVHVLLSAHRVQKVRVLAETVTIRLNVANNFPLIFKVSVPSVSAVMRLGRLQAAQDVLVVIGHSGNLFDPHGPVERVVRVEAVGVRLGLFLEGVAADDVLRWFQVDLQHFAQQDSILVLDLTHALCNNGWTNRSEESCC